MERWREQLYLEHSAKGTTWGKHKYIAIKNGRYIYPEDLKKKSTTSANANSIDIPEGHVSKNYAAEDYARVGKNIASATKRGAKKVSNAWNSIDPEKRKMIEDLAASVMLPPTYELARGIHNQSKDYKKRKKSKKKRPWDEETSISHSAKGTTWEDHKYIKKEDGVYFYPDSYGNGRHLPDGSGDNKVEAGKTKLEDWEIKMHKHVDSIVKQHPELFGTSEKVAENIMSPSAMEAFKGTLKALTGMDPSKMSEAQLNQMRKKIADYYVHDGSSVGTGSNGNVSKHKVKIKSSGKSSGPAYNQGISRREIKSSRSSKTKSSNAETELKAEEAKVVKKEDGYHILPVIGDNKKPVEDAHILPVLNRITDGPELKKKYIYSSKKR